MEGMPAVDQGVELPKQARVSKWDAYLAERAVGESFVVESQGATASVKSAAKRQGKRVVSRIEGEGPSYRCWVVEPKSAA